MRATRFATFLALAALVPAVGARAQDEGDPLKTNYTGNFSGTRLHLVVAAVHEATKLNLIVDPSVDAEGILVTAVAADQPVGTFLAEVEKQARLAHSTWCGAVVLHQPGKGPGAEPALPGGDQLDARLSMQFEATPFMFALERLRTRTSIELAVTARARNFVATRGSSVTLGVQRMQLKHLLSHLARAGGLEWKLEGTRATFDAPGATGRDVDAPTIELTGDNTAVVDAAKLLAELRTPGGREGARRQLIAAGKQVADAVAGALQDADGPTAIAALEVLGRVGQPAQAPRVLAVFRDANRPLDVRNQAGVALGLMKAVDAVPALIDALDDEWFRIAETARNALVQIGEPAVAPLAARYEPYAKASGHDGVVYRSLLIFGSIGTDRCKQLLLDALKTTQGTRAVALRHHAAIGLGFTQDPKVIEPMIEALERERQFVVASYIARSLNWITDQELPPQPGRWRAWWAENKSKVLEPKPDGLYDPIELPTDADGLPLLDSPPPPR
jgi:HEAT repeat protein